MPTSPERLWHGLIRCWLYHRHNLASETYFHPVQIENTFVSHHRRWSDNLPHWESVDVVRCQWVALTLVVHVVQEVVYSLCPLFSTFQQDFLLYLSSERSIKICLEGNSGMQRSQCDKQKACALISWSPTLLQDFSVLYHLSVRCIAIGGYLFGLPLFDKVLRLTLFKVNFFAFVTFANNVPVLLNKRIQIWRKTAGRKWKRIEKKNSDRQTQRERERKWKGAWIKARPNTPSCCCCLVRHVLIIEREREREKEWEEEKRHNQFTC